MEIRPDTSTMQDCTGGIVCTTTTAPLNGTLCNGTDWNKIIRESLMEHSPAWKEQKIKPFKRAIPDMNVQVPEIKAIDTYNDRVVKVTFVDGTFTKCVCENPDEFDEYIGIALCLFKRQLGKDGHKVFNRLMHYAMKRDEEYWAERGEQERADALKKEKRRKAELKRAAKAAKARQEKIDIQSAAVLDALRKYHAEAGEELV